MNVLLQEGVQTGIIDASGWIIGVGGLVLLAVWFAYLTR
jgi:polynucleotide 5'-kinase involved in rRNA processing